MDPGLDLGACIDGICQGGFLATVRFECSGGVLLLSASLGAPIGAKISRMGEISPIHPPDPGLGTVAIMRMPEPTPNGEWSPALPGLERLGLPWVVLVQLVVTILMVGMIWTGHVVHYDLFPLVGAEAWDAYEHAHVDRIGKVLFVPWLIEGLCVLVLLLAHPRRLRIAALVSAFLMLFILIDTAAFSAPAHGVLLDHWDQQTFDGLMVANLIRAVLWTAKGVVAVWMMVEVLRPVLRSVPPDPDHRAEAAERRT